LLAALVALVVVPAPAFLTVAAVTARRPAGFLVRGSLERSCVLALGVLAAVFLAGDLAFFPELSLAACAPALGAAPWVVGEILSGPSAFKVEALWGAIAAAQVGIAAGAAAGSAAAGAVVGALAAASTVLAVRGPPLADSTIYES